MVAELVFHPRITCEDANHPRPAAMAMAIQQQQLPQGDYATMAAAMTPAPTVQGGGGIGEVKMSGQTPCAKRPVTQATIAVAGGGHAPMSMEDLVAGFHNVANLRTRDETWTIDIAKCVEWNAPLLNTLVTRVNGIDGGVARQAATIDKMGEDIKGALGQVQQSDAAKDFILRGELSAMAAKLQETNDEIKQKTEELAARTQQLDVQVAALHT